MVKYGIVAGKTGGLTGMVARYGLHGSDHMDQNIVKQDE